MTHRAPLYPLHPLRVDIRCRYTTLLSFAIPLLFSLYPSSAKALNQCDQMQQLIMNLQSQLAIQIARLPTAACVGPARSICMSRIHELQDQIRNDTAILKTCTAGVIPTSGISAPPPHLPFDLLPASADDYDHVKMTANSRWDYFNNIPRNPQWASLLYDARLPDALLDCNASSFSYNASDWFRCTNDAIWTNHDKCAGGGHVNWTPVMYEGAIQWDGHDRDDDYNIRISRSDESLFTASNTGSVGMEFDSDETIDPFSHLHQWWSAFRSAVDAGSGNPNQINGRNAVVIGLVGLDYQHSSFSELHPLYVLAINVDGPKWAFFVRNWGDEGWCSEGTNPWDVRSIRVLLANPTASDGTVTKSTVFGTNGTAISAFFAAGQGIVLDVQLQAPDDGGFVVGDLEVAWTPAVSAPSWVPAKAVSTVVKNSMSDEEQMAKIIKSLPRSRQLAWIHTKEQLTAARGTKAFTALTLVNRSNLAITPRPAGPIVAVHKTADTTSQKAKTAALCAHLGADRLRFPDLCKE